MATAKFVTRPQSDVILRMTYEEAQSLLRFLGPMAGGEVWELYLPLSNLLDDED